MVLEDVPVFVIVSDPVRVCVRVPVPDFVILAVTVAELDAV
jgi:hypothetical protein